MIVEFWVGGDRLYTKGVPDEAVEECYRLPKSADRFAYWRGVTGDPRIEGHVLVWTPARKRVNGGETNSL